jgi:hypothetical protein
MDWTNARKRRYPVGEAEVCIAASPTDYRGARSSYIAKPMSARASIELLRQFSDPDRKEAVRPEMKVTRGESP